MRYLLTYVLSGITFDKSYTRYNLNFNKRCVFLFIKKKNETCTFYRCEIY